MEISTHPIAALVAVDQLITQTIEHPSPVISAPSGGDFDSVKAAGVIISPPIVLADAPVDAQTASLPVERFRSLSMATACVYPDTGVRGLSFTRPDLGLEALPNEILFHIFEYLDVCDLLAASRTNHHLRSISLTPLLHVYRIRHNRTILPHLLTSPSRPSLSDLQSRHIFLTHTTVVSRLLARSLVSIRLSRRLSTRPSAKALVQRAVLPQECVPGLACVHVSPALVAKKKAIEKERLKDRLRRWVEAKWRDQVREREESARRRDESHGVGRVWRLRRFWERVGRGEQVTVT